MGSCCGNSYFESSENLKSHDPSKVKLSENIRMILDSIDFHGDLNQELEKVKHRELKDTYKNIRVLGTGLFSKVYLVKDRAGNKFAMKVINKKDFTNPEHIQKILIEKELMKRLKHRNVLRLEKTFQTSSCFYFILEYASKGRSLGVWGIVRVS